METAIIIVRVMKGKIGFAGGVVNYFKVRDLAIVVALHIRRNTIDTLNGGQHPDGL